MKKTVLVALGLLAVGVFASAALGHAAGVDPHEFAMAGNTLLAMAVVSKYGTGSRDPSALAAIDGIFAAAEVRVLNSQISIAATDLATSTYRFGEIPSNCILDPNSVLWFGAATGVVDFDIGLRKPNGGAAILADCIVNGHDIHTAGSTTLAAATGSGIATAANQQKRAWQLAGLTSDPGGNLEVYGTANADASAAAVANLFLRYFKGA